MTDFTIREQALDPNHSFIVQAPAGSGKTELLTQRYLVLLAQANKNPEEVLAITFTKKAASEMRSRVMKALKMAAFESLPEQKHSQRTWKLARAVYEKSEFLSWDILNNPNRLRIQTIDAFCFSLARQMPVVSGLGNIETILENPENLYEKAVENLLECLDANLPWSKALEYIILHLNNDISKVKKLLIEMLACRDQWLPHFSYIYPHIANHESFQKELESLKNQLENALQRLAFDAIKMTKNLLSSDAINQLESLCEFSCQILNVDLPKDNSISTQLFKWKIFCQLLLTNEYTWRKSIDKRIGFPAASTTKDLDEKKLFTSMKENLKNLILDLNQNETLRKQLQALAEIPAPFYSQEQWKLITSILQILPVLAAQLNLLFNKNGSVDFIHISGCAIAALENFENPTDLALRLDHQIRHILVDEFQDTSHIQFSLLQKLTQGWESQDGRTLFLVGDPMQSIYRFRMAEVAIFLQVWQSGIGAIKLTPLKLELNFRSTPKIIQSVNTQFSKMFPLQENKSTGEIAYHASKSFHPEHPQSNCYFHLTTNMDELRTKFIQAIQRYQSTHPNDMIAILVRKRSDIQSLLPLLKQNKIEYAAVELEKLNTRQTILDLLALTRALNSLSDRIAWLAILRAKWCGLTLTDLLTIGQDNEKLILESLLSEEVRNDLSEDAQRRVNHFLSCLLPQLENQGRLNYRTWIKETWEALQGPACLTSKDELDEVELYLSTLNQFASQSQVFDVIEFENFLHQRFLSSNSSGNKKLQIMTIHKSKGLEFDSVFLWGLERKPRNNTKSLLAWTQRFYQDDQRDLLIAPIPSHASISDPIYDYIQTENTQKERHESKRLLYVAATRAKRNLHLFGLLKTSEQEQTINPPAPHSFLYYFYETNPELFNTLPIATQEHVEEAIQKKYTKLIRLPLQLMPNDEFISTDFAQQQEIPKLHIPNEDTARLVGIVVHRYLKIIVDQKIKKFSDTELEKSLKTQFIIEGLSHQALEDSIKLAKIALQHCLSDPTALWILNPLHPGSKTEYALTYALHKKKAEHYVLDRTFIDKGVRWIIDYKIIDHKELSEESLRKYQQQLENYAKIMSAWETYPIQLGLYFPLTRHWLTWEYPSS